MQKVFCPRCGSDMNSNANFCENCGTNIDFIYNNKTDKTNSLSLAGFVTSLVSLVIPYLGFLGSITAIILSGISLKQIKRTNEQGKAFAITGLIVGIINTLFYILVICLVILYFAIFWY